MKGGLMRLGVLASILATAAALAAPAAKGVSVTLTDPTGGNASNIKITRPSKFQAKVSAGAVVFSIKLAGVTTAAPSVAAALARFTLASDGDSGRVLICGSLHLAGTVLAENS